MLLITAAGFALDIALCALWGAVLFIAVRHLSASKKLGGDQGALFLALILAAIAVLGRGVIDIVGLLGDGAAARLSWGEILADLAVGVMLFLWLRGRIPTALGTAKQDGASERLTLLFEAAPDAVLILDRRGRLLDVNAAACTWLGYDRASLLSKNIADLDKTHSPEELIELWGRLAAGERVVVATRLLHKSGQQLPAELSLFAFRQADGVMRVSAISRDITERLRQQTEQEAVVAQLFQANTRAAEAISAKNMFLQTVSYKLRTPLNTIIGLTEMISAGVCGPSGNSKIDEYLNDIRSSSLDLLGVIDEVSSVATVEAAIGADGRSYRAIIEMSPDAIFLCEQGVISFINSAGVRLLGGLSAPQFEGLTMAELVHPDYRAVLAECFAAVLGGASATQMQFLHTAGGVVDVQVSVSVSSESDGTVLVIARDITDLVRANRDADAQVKRLNNILDTAVDAVVVSDERGVIETFNLSAERMFGYDADEAIGRNVSLLMSGDHAASHDDYLIAYRDDMPSKAVGMGREVTARRKDGSLFPVEVSLSVCHLEDRRLFTALIRDVTERRNFEDHLAHSATHDALTGLPNRRLLQERLQQALERAQANDTLVAVWFVDLDGFKTVNDVMGHAAGDELLVEAGRRMVASVKPGDTVARFGGDEFALVLRDLASSADVVTAVDGFLEKISEPFMLRGREVTLTANVGIAVYPHHSSAASELVVHAGAAMIVAKATGRNLYRFFDPSMHHEAAERLMLEAELRRGIERGELMLHYQPQVELKGGRIVGLEALVRWNHPTMGMVSPGRFIPVAEETGLIVPLGEWVMRQACTDLRRLEQSIDREVSVALNISPRQFSDADVLATLNRIIQETGINPQNLDVEITESTLMNDPERVIAYLERMKTLGIRLSIDDFGTGYSSLNYLKRFPVDTLKIDRSFVIDIANNSKDEAIAVTIVTLAHSMGMTVLAEGVEYAEQGDLLAQHGCDIIQGFLYSRPLPFETVLDYLQRDVTLPVA